MGQRRWSSVARCGARRGIAAIDRGHVLGGTRLERACEGAVHVERVRGSGAAKEVLPASGRGRDRAAATVGADCVTVRREGRRTCSEIGRCAVFRWYIGADWTIP